MSRMAHIYNTWNNAFSPGSPSLPPLPSQLKIPSFSRPERFAQYRPFPHSMKSILRVHNESGISPVVLAVN